MGLCLSGFLFFQGSGDFLVPGALAGVGRLEEELGCEQVNVISRANSPTDVDVRIGQLELSNFFQSTGLDHSRVHAYSGPESMRTHPSQSQM